ncbi:hypothetical protein AB0F17_62315 [Nonomuraea sp. NPDC026600]|uniref:hypothetical protein n=1 Tax=Nonomuraea sp. NPDC026600 TaxID=3155363 RepID=UPI00340D9056
MSDDMPPGRLPAAEEERCACVRRPAGDEPGPRCAWAATREDGRCDGCRRFCAGLLPLMFEPNVDAWMRILDGDTSGVPAVHLVPLGEDIGGAALS